jgi:hypothetical protein
MSDYQKKCQYHKSLVRGGRSAIEHGPANLIAQPLVVEHEFADLVWKLCALPLALETTSLITLILGSRLPDRLDRVGSRAQLVGCHMAHRPCLSGGVGRLLRRAEHLSCRGVGGKGSLASFCPGDLAPCPSAYPFDRLAWTVISRSRLLEEVQNVLRTIGGPQCKKMVIGVRQGATATYGDEPRVSILGENHVIENVYFTYNNHIRP